MTDEQRACVNTDRELWREVAGDFYAPSVHVTEAGSVGMDFHGHVIVAKIERWHEAMRALLAERGSGPPSVHLPPLPNKVKMGVVSDSTMRYWPVYGYTTEQMEEYARSVIAASGNVEERSVESPQRGGGSAAPDYGKLIPGDMRQVDGRWFVQLETGKWGSAAPKPNPELFCFYGHPVVYHAGAAQPVADSPAPEPVGAFRERIAGAVARGWCSPENSHKVMDATLAFAIIDEVLAALAAPPVVPSSDPNPVI